MGYLDGMMKLEKERKLEIMWKARRIRERAEIIAGERTGLISFWREQAKKTSPEAKPLKPNAAIFNLIISHDEKEGTCGLSFSFPESHGRLSVILGDGGTVTLQNHESGKKLSFSYLVRG